MILQDLLLKMVILLCIIIEYQLYGWLLFCKDKKDYFMRKMCYLRTLEDQLFNSQTIICFVIKERI